MENNAQAFGETVQPPHPELPTQDNMSGASKEIHDALTRMGEFMGLMNQSAAVATEAAKRIHVLENRILAGMEREKKAKGKTEEVAKHCATLNEENEKLKARVKELEEQVQSFSEHPEVKRQKAYRLMEQRAAMDKEIEKLVGQVNNPPSEPEQPSQPADNPAEKAPEPKADEPPTVQ